MKKSFIFSTFLVLILFLGACGSSDKKDDQGTLSADNETLADETNEPHDGDNGAENEQEAIEDSDVTTQKDSENYDDVDLSHSPDAPADYVKIFPDAKVNKIEIEILPENWKKITEDMTEMIGEFGSQKGLGGGSIGGSGQIPEQFTAPCVDKKIRDVCEGQGYTGVCLEIAEKIVACLPENDAADHPENYVFFPKNPDWAECRVKFEDKIWEHVGIRFKGNSSLAQPWLSGMYKLPFKLEFDQFEDSYPEIKNQRFYGFKKLAFGNNIYDSTYMRDKFASDIFRAAGVVTPMKSYYAVFVNYSGDLKYFGLYTVAELPDTPLLKSQFPKKGGNLYKPENIGATFREFIEEDFAKENNEEENDFSDVKNMIAALNSDRSDAAAWRSQLEKYLNVDSFLRWLAANVIIQDWDSYGNMPHNFFLYGDPADNGKLNWIPWDHNMSLDPYGGGGIVLTPSLEYVNEKWPLIRYLADDPVYFKKYVGFLREVLDKAYNPEKLKEKLTKEHDMIEIFVTGDEGELPPYSVMENFPEFENQFEWMLGYFDKQAAAIENFLKNHE